MELSHLSILFIAFFGLMLLRVPIAFSLIGSSIVVFFLNERLEAWTVTQRLFFGIDSFVLLAVPLFILAANIMNRAGITNRLIQLCQVLVGWVSGGLAMINVAVSMLFAGVSGSSTADTAAVGGTLIPQMLKRGYTAEFSVGVTAASSVLGMIIPPSITMIIWASLTSTSVASMFLGGIVPGFFIGTGLMLVAFIISKKRNYPREPMPSSSEIVDAIRGSLLALGVPAIVLGGIVFGIATPTEAAVLAVWYALFLGMFVFRSISVRDLLGIIKDTANLSALPLFALASASAFGYLLAYYQLPLLIHEILAYVNPGYLIFIILITWIFIGTFLDAVPAMIIMIPIFSSTVQAVGLDPVHYGVLSVLALSVGLVTPPYGLCLLIASKIGQVSIVRAVLGSFPFVMITVVIIVICALFPSIITFLPNLLN